MENMSAAMAGKFVEVTKEMTGQIAEIGPNPLRLASQQASNSSDEQTSHQGNQ